MEYYISVNNNELINFAGNLTKLEDHIDGGRPDLGKNVYYFTSEVPSSKYSDVKTQLVVTSDSKEVE